jgi:O-antigen ligase
MRALIKEKGFEYLVYGLLLSLFFSKAIPNIFLGVLFIWKMIDFKSIKKTKSVFFFSSAFILFVLLFFLTFKAIISGTLNDNFKMYKGLALCFLIAAIFQNIEDVKKFKTVILFGINAAVSASLFLIGLYFFQHHTLPFSNTAQVNELLILERPYIGFISVLGFFLACEKVVNKESFKRLWILNAIVLFLFILLISARISIITMFLIAVIYLLFYSKIGGYKKAASLISFIILFGIIVLTNKNISERFFIKNNIEESLRVASDYEPRIVIWKCASGMTNQHNFNPLFGFEGYKTIEENFLDCYAETIENQSKKEYFLEEQFNSHNQFIDLFLIGGVIAFGLFCAFFIKLFIEVRKQFFQTAIMVSFLLFFCVENIFYRQFGCYLFGIFVLFLAHRNQEINE